ncbi:MAG TPA: hypothetical protein PKB06_11925, partial [Actinotalea sp.]|nr:hypothetical protein [Actinotalea sp.]
MAAPGPTGPGCEWSDGFLVEPVSAVTSLAFVIAAAAIVTRRRRSRRPVPVAYAVLVAGVGVGSAVQHGPDPAWADVAHDLPLVGVLCLLAADSAAALRRRPRRWWSWAVPSGLLLVVVVGWPRAGDLAQVGAAVVAAALLLERARRDAGLRSRVAVPVAPLAVGG